MRMMAYAFTLYCVDVVFVVVAVAVEKLDYLLTPDDWYALQSEFDALDTDKVFRRSQLFVSLTKYADMIAYARMERLNTQNSKICCSVRL